MILCSDFNQQYNTNLLLIIKAYPPGQMNIAGLLDECVPLDLDRVHKACLNVKASTVNFVIVGAYFSSSSIKHRKEQA